MSSLQMTHTRSGGNGPVSALVDIVWKLNWDISKKAVITDTKLKSTFLTLLHLINNALSVVSYCCKFLKISMYNQSLEWDVVEFHKDDIRSSPSRTRSGSRWARPGCLGCWPPLRIAWLKSARKLVITLTVSFYRRAATIPPPEYILDSSSSIDKP